MQYYSTILSIFWEQYFSHVFRSLPNENDKDVFIMLDELSSLHLPNFPNIISNARKFKIPILGILQSENQLYNNYGIHNGKVILNNANVKIYFTGLSDESSSISATLGMFEYEDENGSRRVRNLMMPNEVRTMSPDQVLIVPSGMEPIKTKVVPFYKQSKMMGYMNMEAPRGLVPYDLSYTAQYIDFEAYRENDNNDNQ
jgi:type IV secretory pathway TraG/TraD family ATPase VirD4